MLSKREGLVTTSVFIRQGEGVQETRRCGIVTGRDQVVTLCCAFPLGIGLFVATACQPTNEEVPG